MPKIIVIGCGRSGTNIALEILRGSPSLTASKTVEDKEFFQRTDEIPNGYLTKCDTCYFTEAEFSKRMKSDPDLHVVWTLRDPRDMALSKIYRGQPRSMGGDCATLADDATETGCVADIKDMQAKLRHALKHYFARVHTVKMEHMIDDPVGQAWQLARELRIAWSEAMPHFWTRMRNHDKAARYSCPDKSQIELWRHWRDVYGGWFANGHINVEGVFNELSEITRGLGYAP